jgi:hypothetical protein
MRSVNRMIAVPTHPPTQPATVPKKVPMSTATALAAIPMMSEVRAP